MTLFNSTETGKNNEERNSNLDLIHFDNFMTSTICNKQYQ